MGRKVALEAPGIQVLNFSKNQKNDLRPDLAHSWCRPGDWCYFQANLSTFFLVENVGQKIKKRFKKILTAGIFEIFKFWLQILKVQIKVDIAQWLTQNALEPKNLRFLLYSATICSWHMQFSLNMAWALYLCIFLVPTSFELATVYYQPEAELLESEIRIWKF